MSRNLKHAAKKGFIAALCSVLVGCSLLPKEEEALRPPLVKPVQENYSTVEVTKGTIVKAIRGSGTLESVYTDILQFTGQGGRIDQLLVKSGDKVKKGDVLVQLQLDGMDLMLKEQQLALERAKYALKQASEGDKQLIAIATLQVEIEQLKYDRLLDQVNNKQLTAGMDGHVIFVETLKEGDIVGAYQTLVTIADPEQLRVSFRIENPNDIKEVEVGVPATVTLKQDEVNGTVVQTPSSSPTTLNKELAEKYAKTLYIDLEKLPKDAAIGSMVNVTIITAQRDQAVKIPRSGLRSYMGRNFVRVLEEDKRLREVDVESGLVGATEVEIIHGLTEGQVIVLQ